MAGGPRWSVGGRDGLGRSWVLPGPLRHVGWSAGGAVHQVCPSVCPACLLPFPLHEPQMRPSMAVAHEVPASVLGGLCAL